MKTPEEMREFFRSIPVKKKENPYWTFSEENCEIYAKTKNVDQYERTADEPDMIPFTLKAASPMLYTVRDFFRLYHESFGSEAQVLCVSTDDLAKLTQIGVPVLTYGRVGIFDVGVVVLPQDNHMGTSVISEKFWQKYIVGLGITPVLRIHSHHVLDPYQSMTDYSTLNSGTLEMVLGRIYEDQLNVCYWLDVPGTDLKANTFLAKENPDGTFKTAPFVFHGTNPSTCLKQQTEAETDEIA